MAFGTGLSCQYLKHPLLKTAESAYQVGLKKFEQSRQDFEGLMRRVDTEMGKGIYQKKTDHNFDIMNLNERITLIGDRFGNYTLDKSYRTHILDYDKLKALTQTLETKLSTYDSKASQVFVETAISNFLSSRDLEQKIISKKTTSNEIDTRISAKIKEIKGTEFLMTNKSDKIATKIGEFINDSISNLRKKAHTLEEQMKTLNELTTELNKQIEKLKKWQSEHLKTHPSPSNK